MPPPKTSTSSSPSLKSLALDHIQHLTKELKKSGKLTHEQALLQAVQTKEGLEARRIYNLKGSELPFDQAINVIVKRELAKQSSLPTSMRDQILAKRQLAKADVTDDFASSLYAKLVRQAIAIAPPGSSQSAAVASYVKTPPGRAMWQTIEDARRDPNSANPPPPVFPAVGTPPAAPPVKPVVYPPWRPAPTKKAATPLAKEGGSGGSGPRGGRIEDPKISGPTRPADSLPNLSDSIYAQIRADAIAANPTLTAEKAVATYLTSSVGEAAHARWAAARQQEAAQ